MDVIIGGTVKVDPGNQKQPITAWVPLTPGTALSMNMAGTFGKYANELRPGIDFYPFPNETRYGFFDYDRALDGGPVGDAATGEFHRVVARNIGDQSVRARLRLSFPAEAGRTYWGGTSTFVEKSSGPTLTGFLETYCHVTLRNNIGEHCLWFRTLRPSEPHGIWRRAGDLESTAPVRFGIIEETIDHHADGEYFFFKVRIENDLRQVIEAVHQMKIVF